MLRVTTLYASSAVATAAYYTRYLAQAPGEEPGVWSGRQAEGLGLAGRVDADDLQRLLEGRDPGTGTPLGQCRWWIGTTANGSVVRAVAGFDATFSAPKSVSVWWALTGDPGLLAAHDVAVAAALEHLERFGATTRVRADGRRLHLDAGGLSVATFRQTTSRADDPQLHTHAVVSAKVRADGRWLALDARYLKRHQRMLGGLYQSVLRAELSHRYGVAWGPIVNGQAELAGMPAELLEVFSKRTAQVDEALAVKVAEFRERQGRDPTAWERAALTREAAVDTRAHKNDIDPAVLRARWAGEAAAVGWTARTSRPAALDRGGGRSGPGGAGERRVGRLVVARVGVDPSRRDPGDLRRAAPGVVDPGTRVGGRGGAGRRPGPRRLCGSRPGRSGRPATGSDGRSVWVEPIAAQFSSEGDPRRGRTHPDLGARRSARRAVPVAHRRRPPGWTSCKPTPPRRGRPGSSGRGRRPGRGGEDDDAGPRRRRPRRGRAGRCSVSRRRPRRPRCWDTRPAWRRTRSPSSSTSGPAPTARPDRYRLAAGATVIVDEAGMVGTPSLARLVDLAESPSVAAGAGR